MKAINNHTPAPWLVEKDADFPGQLAVKSSGTRILAVVDNSDEIDRANAWFIIRAVNSHDLLLQACKEAAGCIPGETKTFELLQLAIKTAGGEII